MLSRSAEYAIRAVAFVAARPEGDAVRSGEVAAALQVPTNYLSKILHQLAQAGVLLSRRGAGGGFALAVPADELRLIDIAAEFDDVAVLSECFLGRPRCSEQHACSVHAKWKPIAAALLELLTGTTVRDLVDRGGPPLLTGH